MKKRTYGGRKPIDSQDRKRAISIYLTEKEQNILGGKQTVLQLVNDFLKNNLKNNLQN